MPEENKIKKDDPQVDIDTSGPDVDINLPEEKEEATDNINDIQAVHYSRGGPWLDGYQDTEFAEEWEAELDHFEFSLSSFRKIVEIF